jgi:hypothetical protein
MNIEPAPSQVFEYVPPIALVSDFLEQTSGWDDFRKCYIFDVGAYNKAVHIGLLPKWISTCSIFYYTAKRKMYIDRTHNFNSVVTIMRQICRYNLCRYENQMQQHRRLSQNVFFFFVPRSTTAKVEPTLIGGKDPFVSGQSLVDGSTVVANVLAQQRHDASVGNEVQQVDPTSDNP